MKNFEIVFNDEGCVNSILVKANKIDLDKSYNGIIKLDDVVMYLPVWNNVISANELSEEEKNKWIKEH